MHKKKKKSPTWEDGLRSPTRTDSRHQARLFVFEDDDAVIKKIIKGRSPDDKTRFRQTHRVALDWLCDRINLGPARSVAGWRPVRNLCAHNSHSASSSSGSNVNSLFVQTGRNPVQVAGQLKSDVQLSRNSNCKKHYSVRSSTEKSVATLFKRLESPTLTHQPIDDANELLTSQISSEHEPKSVSALSVPCQSNFLKNPRAPWYLGSSAPKQERRSSSQHFSELGGAKDADGLRPKKVDWTKKVTGAKCVLLHGRMSKQLTSKVYVFSESVRCLGGKGQPHPHATQNIEKGSNWVFRRGSEKSRAPRHGRRTCGICDPLRKCRR